MKKDMRNVLRDLPPETAERLERMIDPEAGPLAGAGGARSERQASGDDALPERKANDEGVLKQRILDRIARESSSLSGQVATSGQQVEPSAVAGHAEHFVRGDHAQGGNGFFTESPEQNAGQTRFWMRPLAAVLAVVMVGGLLLGLLRLYGRGKPGVSERPLSQSTVGSTQKDTASSQAAAPRSLPTDRQGNSLLYVEKGGKTDPLVTMKTLQESISADQTTIDVRVNNQRDKTLIFGSEFDIQRWVDGAWYACLQKTGNFAWDMVAYPVEPGQTRDFICSYGWFLEPLQPGRYRVFKSAFEESQIPVGPDTPLVFLYAEFQIVASRQSPTDVPSETKDTVVPTKSTDQPADLSEPVRPTSLQDRLYEEKGGKTDPLVTMSAQPVQLSTGSTTITARVVNSTKHDLILGEEFHIHQWIDGRWYAYPQKAGNFGWRDIALIVEAGKSRDFLCEFGYFLEPLVPGRYRLFKTAFADNQIPVDHDTQLTLLYAEFTVSEPAR